VVARAVGSDAGRALSTREPRCDPDPPVRLADYDAVATVWAAAGREVVPRGELAAKLTRDRELFLVAVADSAVAGVVMGTYDGRRGMDPAPRRPPRPPPAGIATRLVHDLESRFTALGCPRINLLVMPGNTAGLRFWEELGYLPMPDVLCTKPLLPAVPDN
jgi:ribosomal protein S18 acetylase RimI-like enzyme